MKKKVALDLNAHHLCDLPSDVSHSAVRSRALKELMPQESYLYIEMNF